MTRRKEEGWKTKQRRKWKKILKLLSITTFKILITSFLKGNNGPSKHYPCSALVGQLLGPLHEMLSTGWAAGDVCCMCAASPVPCQQKKQHLGGSNVSCLSSTSICVCRLICLSIYLRHYSNLKTSVHALYHVCSCINQV
jgi:hypothetical protein